MKKIEGNAISATTILIIFWKEKSKLKKMFFIIYKVINQSTFNKKLYSNKDTKN